MPYALHLAGFGMGIILIILVTVITGMYICLYYNRYVYMFDAVDSKLHFFQFLSYNTSFDMLHTCYSIIIKIVCCIEMAFSGFRCPPLMQ